MRNFLKKIFVFLILIMPEIVFAADFLVCGNERKFPIIFATMISILYTAIKILVPIFLVIIGMLSFIKAVFAGDSADEMNKSKKRFITSIVAAVFIFFLVPIVRIPIILVGGVNNDFSSCLDCLVKPKNCDQIDSEIAQLCPGLISEQSDYDKDCNYVGGLKRRTDYSSGDSGIEYIETNSAASYVSNGVIRGNKYSSTVPAYKTSTDLLANINYDYYASPKNAGGSNSCLTFYGQCPWFAKGRAIEIVANSNMPDDLKQKLLSSIRGTYGNGGEWYSNMSSDLFEKSTDIYAAKPGSIVSWSQSGAPGHVGIVEDVQYENGKAKKILLSESWNKKCQVNATSYSLKWWDVEQFRHYYGKHNFIGYVYLLG